MTGALGRMGLRAWLTADAPASIAQARAQAAYLGWVKFAGNLPALTGVAIILGLIVVAAFAPLIATHSPIEQNILARLSPPSAEHWFGTDELGRDIFSRVVYGTRITLYVVGIVGITVAPIGLAIGATAGYLGGIADQVLMRVTDIFLAFPSLVLALALVAALGPSLDHAILAISLTAWPGIARLARAEALTIRNSDFVSAVRIQGASRTRLIIRHVMPVCVSSVVVRITLSMGRVILTAAGLGFLGLGAQLPAPGWGARLSTGRRYMLEYWWLAAAPGSAILLISLAFNLFGDGLRDVLDPRST